MSLGKNHQIPQYTMRRNRFSRFAMVSLCFVLLKSATDDLREVCEMCSLQKATHILKLNAYKVSVIHELKPGDPVERVNFCHCF